MTTKLEYIASLKLENPTLRIGDNEKGYKTLSSAEYDAKISEWADNRVKEEADTAAKALADATFAKDRADGLAKLELAGLTIAQAEAVARKKP